MAENTPQPVRRDDNLLELPDSIKVNDREIPFTVISADSTADLQKLVELVTFQNKELTYEQRLLALVNYAVDLKRRASARQDFLKSQEDPTKKQDKAVKALMALGMSEDEAKAIVAAQSK